MEPDGSLAMRYFFLFWVFALLCGLSVTVSADIYEWIDENGIRHFSNQEPLDKSKVVAITRESRHNELSQTAQMGAEKEERLRSEQLKIAEKEIEILERELALERKIEAVNQQAEQTLQKAEALLDEAKASRDTSNSRRYISSGYYPLLPYYPIPHPKRRRHPEQGRIHGPPHDSGKPQGKGHKSHAPGRPGLRRGNDGNRVCPDRTGNP